MATVFPLSSGSDVSGKPALRATKAEKPGIVRRLLRAMMEARQRQADRVIAEMMNRRSGVPARRISGDIHPGGRVALLP